jgi:hypothetical protein
MQYKRAFPFLKHNQATNFHFQLPRKDLSSLLFSSPLLSSPLLSSPLLSSPLLSSPLLSSPLLSSPLSLSLSVSLFPSLPLLPFNLPSSCPE